MLKHVLPVLALGLGLGATAGLAAQPKGSDDATQKLIEQGAYVARLGDCVACHTAEGGKPFAGGLAIKSSLGTIWSTNITPDPETGIGKYTEKDFDRAVRDGIRKDGGHLYPAMPYPSYAKISDADMHALYTYVMKGVSPVENKVQKTALGFPFNMRWGMVFWNMAFGNSRPFAPVQGASDEVNRGAYIVEGLGHCGSCHTPRGMAMQEKAYDDSNADYLAGGDLNGWGVPALRGGASAGPGVESWSEQDIVDYLGGGRNGMAAVGGEMTSVVEHSTSHMSDADLHAVAAFLKTLAPNPSQAADHSQHPMGAQATTAKLTAAKHLTDGERLYIDNCAACHFVDGKGAGKVFPELDGASIVNSGSPTGLIHTILYGARTPSTDRDPSILLMPGFANRLGDQDVAKLASFLRQAWGNSAPVVTAKDVAPIRAAANGG